MIQLTGAALITLGVGLIFLPAGLIVAGIFAVLIGIATKGE